MSWPAWTRAVAEGDTVRDGVRLRYTVHGSGPATVVLLPTWSIVRSRMWKAQVPHLARHHRVVTFDGRGSGDSDRPHRGGRVRQRRVRRRRPRRHGRGGGGTRCPRRPVQRGGLGGPGGCRARGPGRGSGGLRPARRQPESPGPPRAGRVHRPAGGAAGVGHVQPAPLGGRGLRRVRRLLLRPDVQRAALHPSARGVRRMGPGGGSRDPRRLHVGTARARRRGAHRPGDRPGRRALSRAGRARGRGPGPLPRGRPSVRRAHRRVTAARRGRRARAPGSGARPGQPRDRAVRGPGLRRGPADPSVVTRAGTPAGGRGPVLPHRSGPCPARPGDRQVAAGAAPRHQDPLARPGPGDPGAGGGRGGGPSRLGVARQRVDAPRGRVR